MALKTLKDIKEIDGFKIVRKRGELSWDEFDKKRKEYPINITEEKNMISFKLQDGPIKENGINGCQVDTIVETAKIILEEFNKEIPCKQNKGAISGLVMALECLKRRREDREKRSVEGTNGE